MELVKIMPSESVVMKSIYSRLENWTMDGTVLWFLRINTGKIQTPFGSWVQLAPKGTSDFVAVIRNRVCGLSILFIEAKGTGGTLRPDQMIFRKRFIGEKDVHYLVINDPKELDKIVNMLSHDTVSDIQWPK